VWRTSWAGFPDGRHHFLQIPFTRNCLPSILAIPPSGFLSNGQAARQYAHTPSLKTIPEDLFDITSFLAPEMGI
jgi:hypothetical protein